MKSRSHYAIIGLVIGAAVDLLINLLAAALQQHAFADQFSQHSIWWLAGLAVVGLLLGYWLGAELQLPASTAPSTDPPATTGKRKTTTITRLRALLSYAKLRGRGIHLSDILLIGSRLDIDTGD
jgi:hypothetical protein